MPGKQALREVSTELTKQWTELAKQLAESEGQRITLVEKIYDPRYLDLIFATSNMSVRNETPPKRRSDYPCVLAPLGTASAGRQHGARAPCGPLLASARSCQPSSRPAVRGVLVVLCISTVPSSAAKRKLSRLSYLKAEVIYA